MTLHDILKNYRNILEFQRLGSKVAPICLLKHYREACENGNIVDDGESDPRWEVKALYETCDVCPIQRNVDNFRKALAGKESE